MQSMAFKRMSSSQLPVFLSVVLVVQDAADVISEIIRKTGEIAADLVSDYEIVIVDNGSADLTSEILRKKLQYGN